MRKALGQSPPRVGYASPVLRKEACRNGLPLVFTWVGGTHQPWKAAHLEEGKLQFQISTALWLYPLIEKASGVNLEAKSGAGVPEAVRVLSTPATLLEPIVLALAFPLDYFSDVERGNLLVG